MFTIRDNNANHHTTAPASGDASPLAARGSSSARAYGPNSEKPECYYDRVGFVLTHPWTWTGEAEDYAKAAKAWREDAIGPLSVPTSITSQMVIHPPFHILLYIVSLLICKYQD
jgi:hypothetical protein